MQHKVQAKDNISLRRKRNVTNFDFKLWVKVKKNKTYRANNFALTLQVSYAVSLFIDICIMTSIWI